MLRLFVGARRVVVHSAGAAESGIIAVQNFLVSAGHRCAEGVALAQDRVEVADDKDLLTGGVLAQESDDALLRVGRIHWKPSQL